jgi:diguanylate cyclase (GGDEF)-like protein/PAS domain S-box-containing protein
MTDTIPRLALILKTITDGVLVVDAAGIVLYANESAERLIGQGALQGTAFAIPIVPGDASLDINLFRGGELAWAEMRATPIQWEGSPCYVIGLHDITERKLMETALHESEQKFRGIFEQALDGIVLIDYDSGLIRNCNPEFERQTGRTLEQLRRLRIWELRPGGSVEAAKKYRDIREADIGVAGDFEFEKPDGEIVPVECRVAVVTIRNKRYIQGITRDITARKLAEAQLHQAAAVFESTREGVIMTDSSLRILMVNRAFTEITGYTQAEALGNTPAILKSGRHDDIFYAAMWNSIAATGHWQGEIWNRRKTGEVYPELLSISAIKDDLGHVTHYAGVFADISKLKASEAELEFLAHHDPLTRLSNRLLLLSRLEHTIEIARRDGGRLALLMLDLDRFKDVNDIFGHLAGDELLQRVAERLISRMRDIDTVSRLGGDEFAVLLTNIAHPEDAARVADEIIAVLGKPWRLSSGGEVRIGASVGISLYPEHGGASAELLQHADAALYQAKAEGRGRFKYYSDDLTRAAWVRIDLEARLRRAFRHGELRVYYQPQMDIAANRIVGAEALVRWLENGEPVPSACFIPVAEETGLIAEIGKWVLRETCRQGRCWLDAGLPAVTLAVNLSPRQFLHSDIGATVAAVLAETGFPAANLELELTESALMTRETEAVEILNRLRALGVRLAIDDFGTGYSSLAYLKLFPLDVLKIDKSFIDDIPHRRHDMEITATIIAMARTLGMKSLAEGVETLEQLAFLQAEGCDMYQGYLTSPAVPAEVFEKLLRAQKEKRRVE